MRIVPSRRKDYKNHIVTNVRKYINEHVSERLSLNEVAAVFGISPNYLSQLFSKYNDTGFSEYINICKITEAKRLLEEENMKVYEAAEALGFESAFYFSKVQLTAITVCLLLGIMNMERQDQRNEFTTDKYRKAFFGDSKCIPRKQPPFSPISEGCGPKGL